ncbi:hypothetical protein OU787_03675 [Kitasatospora sp. YST-16]|nr:hypothetical protein [Kitasatospora sp. YST-16]WAL70672.1 hypothetical protein OU787_03675 [Kitasatospora sp. YST-16]WNW36715.1 hypothetical protein RKE32_03665 [Streptomyces sp. Li-HN-5-13]
MAATEIAHWYDDWVIRDGVGVKPSAIGDELPTMVEPLLSRGWRLKAAVSQVGVTLDLFESTLHSSDDLAEVNCGEVADVAFDQQPDAFLRAEVRCTSGRLEHGEPTDVRGGELPQRLGQVEANVIPYQQIGLPG